MKSGHCICSMQSVRGHYQWWNPCMWSFTKEVICMVCMVTTVTAATYVASNKYAMHCMAAVEVNSLGVCCKHIQWTSACHNQWTISEKQCRGVLRSNFSGSNVWRDVCCSTMRYTWTDHFSVATCSPVWSHKYFCKAIKVYYRVWPIFSRLGLGKRLGLYSSQQWTSACYI